MFRKLIALMAVPVVLGAQAPAPRDTAFHTITLADAVKLATQNNVTNITAANKIRTDNANTRSTFGRFLPSLTGTLGQTQQGGSVVNPNGEVVSSVSQPWHVSDGLSSSITLYDGGNTLNTYREDKAVANSDAAAETTAEFSTTLNVKTTYNLILAAKESEAAGQAQMALAQENLAATTAKVNAGAANVADSLQAAVQVASAQLAILTAQNTLHTEASALTHLVGTRYLVTADFADTVEHAYAPVDSAAIMAQALNGPQIRQLNASITADQAGLRASKSSYLPTVSLAYSYTGSGYDRLYGIGGGSLGYGHNLGINLNYSLFNNFQRESNVQRSQVLIDNDQANLRDSRLSAQQSILTDIGALRLAEATVQIEELTIRSDDEALRVVQQRYNLGASTLLDVLTAQSNLITARQQLIQARLNQRNARAQIESVIGRDLQ
jgi:outer membrane protein